MTFDKARVRVAVLMGGLSAERPISLKTGEGVLSALRERGWNAVGIDVGRDLPHKLLENQIDVAWVALHGRFGEDGCVQGLLEVMGIPYTGSGVMASAIAMDKIATKRAIAHVPEIVLAADATWRKGDPLPELPFPVIVKPPTSGSTIGIARASSAEELRAALDGALQYDEAILVEELLEGDEITVPVLDGTVLPPVRVIPDSGFYDFSAKYTKGLTRYECPAKISAAAADRAAKATLACYHELGCRGLARADFIIRERDDVPVFLEINTIPGMTATSLSPMAANVVGISYPELCERILLGATCMRA